MKIKLIDMYGEEFIPSYGLFEQFITDSNSIFFKVVVAGKEFKFNGKSKLPLKNGKFKYPFGIDIIKFSIWLSTFDFNVSDFRTDDSSLSRSKLESVVFSSMFDFAKGMAPAV